MYRGRSRVGGKVGGVVTACVGAPVLSLGAALALEEGETDGGLERKEGGWGGWVGEWLRKRWTSWLGGWVGKCLFGQQVL